MWEKRYSIYFSYWNHRFEHSHKIRKDSLETRAVLIKISMFCWNLPSDPKHQGSLQKEWPSRKRISHFQVIFVLFWMKQTQKWFNLHRDGLEMDCLTSRILLQKACSYKSEFCSKACTSSKLVSQFKWWLGKIWRKTTWCVRFQSKCWNNMQYQTQV